MTLAVVLVWLAAVGTLLLILGVVLHFTKDTTADRLWVKQHRDAARRRRQAVHV